MIGRLPLSLALLSAVLATSVPHAAGAQTYACEEVMIPMRDGVRLAADVYRPTQGEGPFPVLLERTPYDKRDCAYGAGDYFARRGYAVIVVDERGRYRSEGQYYWWYDNSWQGDQQDGVDLIEWAGTRSWSTGKVGTMGLSMGCFNQYTTAPADPPHLAAMFCSQAAGNPYKDLFYQGGALHLIMPTWLLTRNKMARPFRIDYPDRSGYVGSHESWREWYVGKQRAGMGMSMSMVSPLMQDMVAHPHYDEYWKAISMDEHLDRVDVPIFHYGGWYDRYSGPQWDLFIRLQEEGGARARENQRILMGPWTHGGPAGSEVTHRVVGEVDFGPEAAIDYNRLRLQWFDHHLKGVENELSRTPPVKIFVMGENAWRHEDDLPLERAVPTDFYFRAGPSGSVESLNDGRLLREAPGEEAPDRYEYDPMDPVPTVGGDLFIAPNGAMDHRPAERRSLTYTTPPLEADTEVTGRPVVELFAASSARDTDWVVTISDVHPDGYSQHLRQNLLRARFRNGFEEPALLEPERVYPFEIRMYPISNVFAEGHRIRITVTSSSFPKWYPNGNTGEEMDGEAGSGVVARNEVHHDREHPSRVRLPIIPRQEEGGGR